MIFAAAKGAGACTRNAPMQKIVSYALGAWRRIKPVSSQDTVQLALSLFLAS